MLWQKLKAPASWNITHRVLPAMYRFIYRSIYRSIYRFSAGAYVIEAMNIRGDNVLYYSFDADLI